MSGAPAGFRHGGCRGWIPVPEGECLFFHTLTPLTYTILSNYTLYLRTPTQLITELCFRISMVATQAITRVSKLWAT